MPRRIVTNYDYISNYFCFIFEVNFAYLYVNIIFKSDMTFHVYLDDPTRISVGIKNLKELVLVSVTRRIKFKTRIRTNNENRYFKELKNVFISKLILQIKLENF